MDGYRDIAAFVAAANRATSLRSLGELVDAAARGFGAEHFAFVHHVDLVRPPPGTVRLSTYPESWADQLRARRYYADDPILSACQHASAGFFWADIARLMRLTPRHREILDGARRHGLGGGFTVPATIRGEPAGSASFAVGRGRTLPGLHVSVLSSWRRRG
jgi:LuxR family transcriptional regulator, quorum-sensing system regulator CciR